MFMSNNNQIKTCVDDEKHPVFIVGNNVKLDDKSYGLLNESNDELFIKTDGPIDDKTSDNIHHVADKLVEKINAQLRQINVMIRSGYYATTKSHKGNYLCINFLLFDGSKMKSGPVGSGSLIVTKKAIVNGWYSLNNQVIHSTDYVDEHGTINHVHSTQLIESITNEIPLIFDDIFVEFSSKKVLTL